MPARNVNLTENLDKFILSQVESGKFENASEVVRTALRNMEREEQEYQARLASLKAEIDKGFVGGKSSRKVPDIAKDVKARLKKRG